MGRYLCRSLGCVWRSCGRQPPLPPSAPPGSRGYSGRRPPAPVRIRCRRTGCGAAAVAAAGEARTRRTGWPGRGAAARWAPSPRAGGTSGGSRSVPNRIRCPAVASEGGYCPGGRWIPLSRRNVCRVPVRVERGNRESRRSPGWSWLFGCGDKNVGWFLSITGLVTA